MPCRQAIDVEGILARIEKSARGGVALEENFDLAGSRSVHKCWMEIYTTYPTVPSKHAWLLV